MLLCTFRVSSINYYLVCSLPIPKICALRDFCAIDDEKLRRPRNPGSGWVKVIESYTSEFLMCHVLLVINRIRGRILHRLRDIAFHSPPSLYFATPLVFNAPDGWVMGFPGTISVKVCKEVSGWPGTIVERFNLLSRVHERYRQTTDRRICDSKDPNVTWSRSGKKKCWYGMMPITVHYRSASSHVQLFPEMYSNLPGNFGKFNC